MKLKTRTLAILAAITLVCGAIAQTLRSPLHANVLGVFLGVTTSFLIFVWYRIDARERLYSRPRLLDSGVAGASILAMPYYFIRTRGFWRGALSIGLFLLGIVGLLVVTLVGSLIAYLFSWRT